MEIINIILLIVVSCLWVYSRQQAKKLADSTNALREAAALIEDLAAEIAKRDGIIERNNHMWKYSEEYTESLQRQLDEKDKEIAALRAEVNRKDEVIQRAADRLHQSVLKVKESQSKLQRTDTD